MSLNLNERILAWAHARRTVSRDRRNAKHEPETPFIKSVVSPGDVCLHIGASDGRHSVVMAEAAGQGRIYAFEPNSYSFQSLKDVLRMHGLTTVEPIHAAVTDTGGGEIVLNIPVKSSGREGRSFGTVGEGAKRSEVDASRMKKERVRTVSIDQFVVERGLKNVAFIRMDIEGAEALALKGATATLDRWKPNALVELHPISLAENFNTDAATVTAVFLNRGYRMFGLDSDGQLFETRECASDLAWKDYFFLHADRAHQLPAGEFRRHMIGE